MALRKTNKKRVARQAPKIKGGARTHVGKDRLGELVTAGFNEGVLRAFVHTFPHASKERNRPLAGMNNRQIMRLAQRICRVASEITALNDNVSKGSGRPVCEVPGARLPVELGLYATWLLFLSKTPLEHRASDRQLLELLLIAATRKFTGKSHYAALSGLLSDASGEDVSGEALLQLACDHKAQLEQIEGELHTILAPLLPGPAD